MEGNWNGASAEAKNKYQYGGKELNTDFGLDWNDHGARFYDATIGKWNGVDPKASKLASYSPYAFCLNRPIILADPDGKYPILTITNERTGYTIMRVPGAGDKNFIVPTYRAVLTDVTIGKDGKKITTELGTYHVTRDGWYSLGYDKNKKLQFDNRGFQPREAGETTYKAIKFAYEAAGGTAALALRQNQYNLDNKIGAIRALPLTNHKYADGTPLPKAVDRKIDDVANGVMVHIIGAYQHEDGKTTLAAAYGCIGVVNPENVYTVLADLRTASANGTYMATPSNGEIKDLSDKIDNASEPQKLEVVIPQQPNKDKDGNFIKN